MKPGAGERGDLVVPAPTIAPMAVHASLAVRLFPGPFDFRMLGAGAAGNAAAIAVLTASLLGSAVAWRIKAMIGSWQRHASPVPL